MGLGAAFWWVDGFGADELRGGGYVLFSFFFSRGVVGFLGCAVANGMRGWTCFFMLCLGVGL